MQTRWTAALVALLISPTWAGAAPLDPAACDALKAERGTLVAAGIETDVARGPEWAKTNNVAPDRLKQIARMIEVDEQLSFRCGEPVTARPALKEPPKPVEAAVAPAKKEATAGQAATLVSPTGDAAPAKKKKKSGAKKSKNKDASAGPGSGGGAPP